MTAMSIQGRTLERRLIRTRTSQPARISPVGSLSVKYAFSNLLF